MTDRGNGVERTLGILTAQMDAQSRQFDDVIKRLDRAEEKRGAIYERLEEQGKAVAALERDMTSVKPAADDVRRMKLMGLGALGIVGVGGGALGASLADISQWLARLFRA